MFNLAAFQDLEKKTTSSGKIKKLGKILTSRKHHTNQVDGGEKETLTDSMGSLLDNENITEHGEHVFDDAASDSNSQSDDVNMGEVMESEDTVEDKNLVLGTLEQENIASTEDY